LFIFEGFRTFGGKRLFFLSVKKPLRTGFLPFGLPNPGIFKTLEYYFLEFIKPFAYDFYFIIPLPHFLF